jgi:signal transduction histidine kinase
VSPVVTSLIAIAGVHLYVALYYGALYGLRRQPDHRAFAAMCAAFGVASFGAALTMTADSVAEGVTYQRVQHLGVTLAPAFFVDFVLHLADEPRPRLIRGAYFFAGFAVACVLAHVSFDPAFADPAYDWGVVGPTNRPIAELSLLGMLNATALWSMAVFAAVRLFVLARDRAELRIAALATVLGLGGGIFDLVARAFDLTTLALSAHTAVLPMLGFSYVLVGRFSRIDAELADRTGELARSYDHLRHAQEELVRKEQLAAVGELSAVIAHEVRNPLAIIKNAVGGLRRRELAPSDADTLLGILDEETDRLNRLVNDLLAYAKPIAPDVGQVDMRNLVMHAVELAAGGSPDASRVEVELDLERPVDLVEGDEALLRHALINIVDNALQAMPNGGTLTITCRNTSVEGRAFVAVDFNDTGEGMDTLVRSKARDPFFTTRQTGTGLGLAIVDRVARAHGGHVEIESRHGLGSTVSFIVPRDRASLLPRETPAV